MTDLRRTMLWMVFLFAAFLLWNNWNVHNGHASFFAPPPPRTAAPPAPTPGVPSATTSTTTGAGAIAAAVPASGAAGAGQVLAQTINVTTDLVKATLSSEGGSLVRLELLGIPEHIDEAWYEPALNLFKSRSDKAVGPNIVLLDQSSTRLYVVQSGLIGAPGSNLPNHATVMNVEAGDRNLQAGQNQIQVRFEAAAASGLKVVKTYTFERGHYVIDVKTDIVNATNAPVDPQLYMQIVRDGNPAPGVSHFYSTFTGPTVYNSTNHFTKIDFKALDKRATEGKPGEKGDYEVTADNGWVAMVQHYFATAWLLPEQVQREFFARRVDTNKYAVGMIVPMGSLAPGATKTLDARLFVGPEEENKLSALAPGLELVKDYGVFKIIAEPLFWLLNQLHKLIGNWGWSIIGLVVLLKIAFYWFNAKAYTSMAKMKAVNPRITEMRERLKDKPQQMQQEMMRIYREEKVNPLGGCLPILIQMPVFIGLYWVLLSSVEMRNAPWTGWIHDLSVPDPFFILPVLMTATSLVQVWLQPTPPDPMQAKMMWYMPIAFSVMFFFFPAGLVVYYVTNNILTILQQYIINKRLGVLGKG
jgi:YidC/Oxa1 family membrane protein insertase